MLNIIKTEKPLGKEKEREKSLVIQIRDEKRDITTDTGKIQRLQDIIFKNWYSTKLEKLGNKRGDEFLDTFGTPILSQDEII